MPDKSQNILSDLQVSRLPTLPHVLVDMLSACQESTLTFQELADIISRDVAVSSRVVSMANSSFFNRGQPIRSLDRALLILGTETIKTIVITASIQQFFSGFKSSDRNYLNEFWRQSLNCALLSKSLAILTSYPHPEEAYLCGLLHNLGQLVLVTNYNQSYFDILNEQENNQDLTNAEKNQFGISHSELGAQLIESWGFTEYAADAIRYHESDLNDVRGAHHLTKIIFLASELSAIRLDDELKDRDSALELFELNPSLVNEIAKKIAVEVEDIARSIGIQLENIEGIDKEESDQAAGIALAKGIRDQNLLGVSTSLIEASHTKEEFSKDIAQTLSLLFGYQNTSLFWRDEQELVEVDNDNDVPMQMSLNEDGGLVSHAARENTTLSSFIAGIKDNAQERLAVSDQQLIRKLHSNGILCLPLADKNEECLAVIVTGISSGKEEIHPRFLELLLAQFSEQAIHIKEHPQTSERDNELDVLNDKVREIAHEANNPLSIINNYLTSLSLKLGDKKEVQEELIILREEVNRASQIIMRLRDIQNDIDASTEEADINSEITNLSTLYKNSLFVAKQIDYKQELDQALTPLKISSNSLRQILTNLIKNAVEALPEGGKIITSTRASINVNGQKYAEILIRDNGPGIPQEVQNKLFNPVQSSKGSGHSGLGLSITKNLVTEARGTITCRSDSEGTQFQILLPLD